MRFEVRAYAGGRITSHVIEAADSEAAQRRVSELGERPVAVQEARKPFLAGKFGSSNHRFGNLLFVQELLALLEAGLSIIVAVETLWQRENSTVAQGVMARLVGKLREGKSLGSALEELPEAFPTLLVGMVRSAERTGSLSKALERYIDYRHRIDGLRTKLINAAIYPSLLLLVAGSVSLFLGGYVVPRFASIYKGTGRDLPWASQLLLQWGTFVSQHATQVIAASVLIAIVGVGAIRQVLGRGGLLRLMQGIPFVWDRIWTYELSRLYLTLGMLLDSGLAVMPALALADSVVAGSMKASIQQASNQIRTGQKLSQAFEQSNLTTVVAARMMKVGEDSGRLGEMLTRTAHFHDEEAGRWIERFSKVAEPVLMVAIGLFIGVIVILLYMPVFDLAGSIR